jgi:site-specific DNA recombinase
MIGIYCRISKRKEEGRDVSIAVQKENGIKFATQQRIPYKLFVDEGISGAKGELADRPMFAELFKAIEDKKIAMVYCYDQSRIERNSNIWSLFVGVMLKNECKYYPEGKFFDLDDPTNRFFSGILSLSNELYSSLTSKKVKDAIYKNVRQGKAHGLTAYGYKKNSSGYFELSPKEAKVVEKIYALSLKGIGTYRIAAMLNSEGIPTKFNSFKGIIKRKDEYTGKISEHKKEEVKWRGNVVHDIIRNSIYKGERVWKDEIITVPAIVSKETWEKVNRNLTANKKNAGKRAECGSEMRGKMRLKGNDNAYKCKRKSSSPKLCKESRGISIPKLESAIMQISIRLTEMRYLIRTLKPKSEKEKSVWENKLIKLRNDVETESKRIKRILKLLVDSDIEDFSDLKIQLSLAKKRKTDLLSVIEDIEKKVQNFTLPFKKKNLPQDKNNLDLDEVKSMIHSTVESITVTHKKLDKGGLFKVSIKFRKFAKSLDLQTDWQAIKWEYLTKIPSEDKVFELIEYVKIIP